MFQHFKFRFSVFQCSLVLCLALLLSCKDVEPDLQFMQAIELSDQHVEIGCDGRYYTITAQLTAEGYVLGDVSISTNADWIRLEADTLSRDGRLTFYVRPNTDARSRDGLITLSLPNPLNSSNLFTSQLSIHQRSEAENDDNALIDDSLTRKARVGYGYNMLIDYMDPESVTEPILDYSKLVQAETNWGTIISEEGRAQQSLTYHSSYSIEEMSAWMTEQTTTEVNYLFCNKRVTKFRSTYEYDLSQQTFGYSSLSKVVATRYIDEGKVQSIIRQGEDIFTQAFLEIYKKVNKDNPAASDVAALVQQYGTHLVTYVDLGGRLDYSVNFQSDETSRESVDRYMEYKNGHQKKNKESEEASHAICTSGDGLYFDIYGGTAKAVEDLRSHAKTSDRYGQVDPGVLGAWLNSINTNDPQSVSLVRCILQPIWQLFTNQQARVQIINHILALSYSESGQVGQRLQELGLDNYYQLNVTNEMQQFGTDANSTLAKIIYYDGLPKIEVCNEYVPELRGDRRVNIFYPIFRGKTNIRRGFFLGDGENAPAEVTFDNTGSCYVRPLDGYNAGDRLTTLYYIDGAFYPTSIGINIPPYQMLVKDETFDAIEHKYPIVKIGPSYWSRQNIRENLYFGEPVDPTDPYCEDYDYYEDIINDMLYANVYYGAYVPTEFENYFEAKTDATGKRAYWFIPGEGDITSLQHYLGNNCKALFPNQQSGFEAQFAGYYGRYDDLNGGYKFNDGREDIRYRNQYCFIVAKDGKESQALLLAPDYSIKKTLVNLMYTNWYPIRVCRLSNYIHPNLK